MSIIVQVHSCHLDPSADLHELGGYRVYFTHNEKGVILPYIHTTFIHI